MGFETDRTCELASLRGFLDLDLMMQLLLCPIHDKRLIGCLLRLYTRKSSISLLKALRLEWKYVESIL